uniref:Uncharacterized protein n=1 Tax=mine drainage metagenome TaxID=410659 RepID=E6QCE7_9ZZZZ
MCCGGGAYLAKKVGRRSSDAAAKNFEQRQGEGMIGNSQSYRILTAGHHIGQTAGAAQDHGEWTWPITLREAKGRWRNIPGPSAKRVTMRHVNDQRMVGWPALCRKNAGHGCGVFRIGPEAVDRLSGEGDEATTVQDSRSFLHCGAKFLTRSHGLVAPRRGWQRRTLVMRGPLPPLPVESQPDSVSANKD